MRSVQTPAMAQVVRVLEERVSSLASAMEESVDAELHRLETLTEEDLEGMRTQRLAQLKRAAQRKQEWLARGHGEYRDLPGEREFFAEMKGEDRFVCHFYRSNNTPCKVIDRHLEALCKLHLETKFVRIDAEKSPYLTEKLKVWMLPTLALCRAEKVVDYVVGFDDLGGRDDFSTETLRLRLAAAGAISYEGGGAPPPRPGGETARPTSIRQGGRAADDEDSDFD